MKKKIYGDFPQDEKEARRRYNKFVKVDPFPGIRPALLTSVHFKKYAQRAVLIHPFVEDADKSSGRLRNIKGASYAGHVGEKYFAWDNKKLEPSTSPDEYVHILKTGGKIEIPPFGLVYVETKETFFLPNYIAARFNLSIDWVHRGLLVGTGPLVDPGFAGKLLIPIHNLTSNTYELLEGQRFIWIEFTKLSTLSSSQRAQQVGYPDERKFLTTEQMIDGARGVTETDPRAKYPDMKSGIPYWVAEVEEKVKKIGEAAADSKSVADAAKKLIQYLGLFGAIVGAAALFGVIYTGFALFWGVWESKYELLDRLTRTETGLRQEQAKVEAYIQDVSTRRIELIETDINSQKAVLAKSSATLAELRRQMKEVQTILDDYRKNPHSAPSVAKPN